MLLHWWFRLIWYTTWPRFEKVEFWPSDPTPLSAEGVRVCGQNVCYHVAALVVPFNLIYNMFWKKWIMTLWPHSQVGEGRDCRQNVCFHVASYLILFNLICNMTMFWKKWILTISPHPLCPPKGSDSGLGSKSCLIYFICMYLCLHANFQEQNIDKWLS